MPKIYYKVKNFNNKFALLITKGVGTMACAYLFCLLALSGLHAALRPGGIGLSNWFAEEFIQLVLLSIIMVGQNLQSQKTDQHSKDIKKIHEHFGIDK